MTSASRLGALGLTAVLGVMFAARAEPAPNPSPAQPDIFGPILGSEPTAPTPRTPLERLAARGQVTERVRFEVYGSLRTHPLVEEAAEILATELMKHAEGVYVTSAARAPEDQRRLMRQRRYRSWTTPRSKHLLGGLAVDIGFVGRHIPMNRMRDVAQDALEHVMGPERAAVLRVVKESRCLHIEIDTWKGKDLVDERVEQMVRLGILEAPPWGPHPVPKLRDYVPERVWLRRPSKTLVAVAF